MESIFQDIRYAVRTLFRQPRFLITTVLILAIGIGANTAIFSVLNGVVLKPLRYEEAGQLVKLNHDSQADPGDHDFFCGLDFIDFREQAESFKHLACYYDYREWGLDLTGGDRPLRVITMPVSADYFSLLGYEPLLGRLFEREEERYDNTNIIISHRLWQQTFNGDPGALGESVELDGSLLTIIGVMPSDFSEPFGRNVDVWLAHNLVPGFTPAGSRFSQNTRDNYYLSAIGRLRSGVSIETAQAELDVIVSAIDRENPERDPWRARLVPLNEAVVGGAETMLVILLAAVGLVLLIACVNVANLSLARSTFRERELAVRSALGSSRPRLMRQMLTESLVLAALGGLAGLALAFWGVKLLLVLRPEALPRINDITFSLFVFVFAGIISVLTAIIFGLIPAVRFSRPEIERSLRETGRSSSTGMRHRRLRGSLIVSQTGLALILLICAALLIQSVIRLRQVDLGFEPESVLTFDLSLPLAEYGVEEPSRRITFYRVFHERIEAIPGVRAVGAVSRLPVTGEYHSWGYLLRGESEAAGENVWHIANIRVVADRYYDALGTRIIRGRFFNDGDNMDSPPVTIINQSFADRHFPDVDPVGQEIWRDGWRQVVGVVEDVRIGFRDEMPDKLYIPYNQFAYNRPWVMAHVIAADGNLEGITAAVRDELAAIDANLVMFNVGSMDRVVGGAIARERFAMILMAAFAGIALLLAVVGIYGVLSYTVNQRYHEIGIRIALGAGSKHVRRSIVWEGMLLALTGIVVGVAAATALTHWLGSLVFGIGVTDAATFAGVAVILAIVAWAACFLPAQRATRADPLTVLRSE